MLKLLSNEELALRWHEIKPEVDKALEYGTGDITAHDLFMECMSGIGQCWVWGDMKAVAMSRFIDYKQYRELMIVTTTGKGWIHYGPECLYVIEQFAKRFDCRYVTIIGRKGWARVLPEEYTTPYHIYQREV